uniref:Reverse transcriptase domain-containing protein n=1 Tax=Tanacetum cinerariifolium TaxID=118510 RepID=A0A6L2M0X2_TANCI|nr:reverse transcriptase domain-containing protein [Tanacetum cinerariifolium]
MRISGFMHGITNPELIKCLHENILKSVEEMMRVTTTFLKGKVAASNQARKKILPTWKQKETRRKQNLEKRGDIRNQQRSERRVARQRVTQSSSHDLEILFPPLGVEDGAEGPMIIEAEIGGYFIHRIYVDGGSALEILYEHCFNRLRPEVKNQMVSATAPLIGFSEEIIWPTGEISLPVKIGDAEHSTSTWMNFVMVRSPSPYNRIIGRPRVRKIQVVPSTAHEMLKFLVSGGILTLQSSKIIPLKCTMDSGPEEQPSTITRATEERIKVEIHPEYPEQTIARGSTLREEGRKALCRLLRRNIDIFIWKPEDMKGVPRHIAKHRLNVREGCPPVRQKKRSQAPERNKAIQKEVEKLVDTDILKEVHYRYQIR